VTELGRPRRPPSGIYSRIANKASNLILVPFGLLAKWLKLFTPLAAAPGPCRHNCDGTYRMLFNKGEESSVDCTNRRY